MKWIEDFFSLLYPKICLTCDNQLVKGEYGLCSDCLSDLPYTGYLGMKENPVMEVFNGRLRLMYAASLLHFEKGNKTQKILHELKYRNNPEIGKLMGGIIGREMNIPENVEKTLLIPVPLHPDKMRLRGYNQSYHIAKGISVETGIRVENKLLIRKEKTDSQTRKKRYDRWNNVRSVFKVNKGLIRDAEHVMLVDDVVTTGATIEACALSLLEMKKIEISVITLARSD
jgi:ComF family protein